MHNGQASKVLDLGTTVRIRAGLFSFQKFIYSKTIDRYMKLNKKHEFILYALMRYLKKLNKRFEDKPLEASVSKIDFIRMLLKLGIVEKSQRGLYRNLEILQKKKLIRYENKFLKLTERGLKVVRKKELQLYPYLKLIVKMEKGKVKTTKSPQSYFK